MSSQMRVPKEKYHFLAKDMREAVRTAAEHGIHHSKVAFVTDAHYLRGRRGMTLIMCDGFKQRNDAQEIITCARIADCQIILPSAIDVMQRRREAMV